MFAVKIEYGFANNLHDTSVETPSVVSVDNKNSASISYHYLSLLSVFLHVQLLS